MRWRCIYLITSMWTWTKSSLLIGPINSRNSLDARGLCAKKLGPKLLVAIPTACPNITECKFNANQYELCSPEELFNVCFKIASSVFVCLLLPDLDLIAAALFRHFWNLPVNFKCAKIILTHICNIYSLVEHEIRRVDLLQNVNWYN